MKKFILAVSVVIFLLALQPAEAAFPERPITIFNASTAGSPADVAARQIAHHAEQHLGQPMVVVNRPGGGGGVMFAALLSEPTDGYTIGSVTAAQMAALQAQLEGQFSFDDFEFLANVQVDYFCFAVLTDSPFYTIDDVVEAIRGGEGVLIGGQGTGSALHLMTLQLGNLAGINFTWLPFQGGADSVVNLLGGHVHVIATAPATVMQYVEAGQIRVIGVSGEERTHLFPDIKTLKEQGYDIVLTQYRGFIARRGIPEEIRAQIVDAIYKATQEPVLQEQGFIFMGPEEFTVYARGNFDRIGELMELMP